MTGHNIACGKQASVHMFHSANHGVRKDKCTALHAYLTWTHTVAPDALLDEVCSHGLCEANHGRLGCTVHASVHNP